MKAGFSLLLVSMALTVGLAACQPENLPITPPITPTEAVAEGEEPTASLVPPEPISPISPVQPAESATSVPAETIESSATMKAIDLGNGMRLVSKDTKEENQESKYEIETRVPYIEGPDDPAVTLFNQEIDSLVSEEVADFKRQAEQLAADFPDQVWNSFLSISHTATAANSDLISVLLSEDIYTGGAHPNHFSTAINYDLHEGRVLALSDLFKADSDYLGAIADYAVNDLKARDVLFFEEGAAPTAENYQIWNLTPEGLLITFDPYQVAPYSEGPQKVLIPYVVLRGILEPNGPAATFVSASALAPEGIDLGDGMMVVSKDTMEESQANKYEIEIHVPHIEGSDDPGVTGFNQEIDSFASREVTDFKHQAEQLAADFPDQLWNSALFITYTVPTANSDLISVLLSEDIYTGGAHPNHFSTAINYDLHEGRVLALSELFKADSDYLGAIADYAVNDLKARDALFFEEGAAPIAENYQIWNLTPEGLLITFDPYQVAPYAAGTQEVLVPYSELLEIIDPQGPISLFTD